MASSLFFASQICQLSKSLAFSEGYEIKGVKFYPIKVRFLFEFYLTVSVLMVRQDRQKDKTLMKLPYLWFLFYAWDNYKNKDYAFYMTSLLTLLELATGATNIDMKYLYDENHKLAKCILEINDVEFNAREFEEIRDIILLQAGIDFDKSFVNEDAENATREGVLFDNKQSGYIAPSLEDLLDLTSMYLRMSVDEICEKFTIRKFNNLIKRMSAFEDYKLLKGAELAGWVTFKKQIPHWIGGLEKYNMFKGENKNYKASNIMKI